MFIHIINSASLLNETNSRSYHDGDAWFRLHVVTQRYHCYKARSRINPCGKVVFNAGPRDTYERGRFDHVIWALHSWQARNMQILSTNELKNHYCCSCCYIGYFCRRRTGLLQLEASLKCNTSCKYFLVT